MPRKLVEVINYPKSICELYLSEDCAQITEVKMLPDNRVKEYQYSVEEFFRSHGASRRIKNKMAIAMTS